MAIVNARQFEKRERWVILGAIVLVALALAYKFAFR